MAGGSVVRESDVDDDGELYASKYLGKCENLHKGLYEQRYIMLCSNFSLESVSGSM